MGFCRADMGKYILNSIGKIFCLGVGKIFCLTFFIIYEKVIDICRKHIIIINIICHKRRDHNAETEKVPKSLLYA